MRRFYNIIEYVTQSILGQKTSNEKNENNLCSGMYDIISIE